MLAGSVRRRCGAGNLGRGVSYCVQVQALGVTPTQSSQLSARACATTIPDAPGVPTNLSFMPLSQGLDLTFGPAANGTTYTISLNGTVARSHVPAGTYRLSFPVLHNPPGGSATGTVTVQSDANAGGAGGTARLAVWAYDPLPVIECANTGAVVYGTAAVGGCGPNTVTVAHPSYVVSNGLPSVATDQIDCIYSAPASMAKTVGIYIDIPAGAGSSTCKPPPAGYGAGTPNANSWTQPGGTHTARVDEWQATEPGGWVVHPLTGPGETPEQVAGSTLTNKHIIYTVYQDIT